MKLVALNKKLWTDVGIEDLSGGVIMCRPSVNIIGCGPCSCIFACSCYCSTVM